MSHATPPPWDDLGNNPRHQAAALLLGVIFIVVGAGIAPAVLATAGLARDAA